MAKYIGLGKFTDQGVRNIKGYPNIVKQAEASFPPGVKLESFYITQGRYDAIVVFEAPDNETALKLIANVSANGNTRWETCPAVTLDRFGQLLVG